MNGRTSYEQLRARRREPPPAVESEVGGRFTEVVEKVQQNLAQVMSKIEALDRSIRARVG